MNTRFFLGCLGLLVLTAGCGEPRPEGLPELYPVTLTITQDGAPLADASVTLFPQDSALARWPSGGQTDASGNVQITTFAKYPGAPAGTFKVTVTKLVTEGDPLPTHPGRNATREQIVEYDRAMKTGSFQAFHVVSAEHRTPNTTPLSIDVSSSGPNTITLDVGAAVKERDSSGGAGSGANQEYQEMGGA